MKTNKLLLLSSVMFLLAACGIRNNTSSSQTSSSGKTSSSSSSSKPGSSSSSSGSNKVTVATHTLSDSNPPVTEGNGEEITSSEWNAIRNKSQSAFNNQYNYTYQYRYASKITDIYTQKFTKNGWMVSNPNQSTVYYENKNGTCYSYTSTTSGYLRSPSSENIQSRCTNAIQHEVQTHMKEMSNYEFVEDDDTSDDFYFGYYNYVGVGFGYQIKFQNGYITWLHANIDGDDFEIKAVFETTINTIITITKPIIIILFFSIVFLLLIHFYSSSHVN